MPGRIAVVGGANMDIGGFPEHMLVAGDSNPGRVRMTVGGVGRNIAENLVRMGLEVELITAVGDDANGRAILEDCRQKGIGTSAVQVEKEESTSVYLFVDDAQGEMSVAINDMAIQQKITPQSVAPRLDMLRGMDAVVLDANLPQETIIYLAENLQLPLFADAVSAAKVSKLKPVLGRLHGLKPNRIEAELLTGISIHDAQDAAKAAQYLLDRGLQRVYLTLGPRGALCAGKEGRVYLSCSERKVVNASGAGDAFTAAMVWSWCEGLSLRDSGVAGMAASLIAMESISAVNPEMRPEKLREAMEKIQNTLNQ